MEALQHSCRSRFVCLPIYPSIADHGFYSGFTRCISKIRESQSHARFFRINEVFTWQQHRGSVYVMDEHTHPCSALQPFHYRAFRFVVV